MTHKLHNRLHAGLLITLLPLCAPAQQAPGTISGIVYGPDGKPLPGTTVWANLVSAAPRPVNASSGIPTLKALTAADGLFTLSQVPLGDYVLCARNVGVAALNPCGWGTAPRIQVTNGRPSMTGQEVRMAAGVTLQVHLDDPAGHLAAHEGKTPGASLIMGVATTHGFHPLPIAASSANGRDYKLLVPFDVTHNVSVSTRYYKINDETGAALNTAGQAIPVSFTSGTPPKVVNLKVVGIGN